MCIGSRLRSRISRNITTWSSWDPATAAGLPRRGSAPCRLRRIVLLQCGDNQLFLPTGSAQTQQWLRQEHGDGACERLVVSGYAHLDCFIGRAAARDVFALVLTELDRLN